MSDWPLDLWLRGAPVATAGRSNLPAAWLAGAPILAPAPAAPTYLPSTYLLAVRCTCATVIAKPAPHPIAAYWCPTCLRQWTAATNHSLTICRIYESTTNDATDARPTTYPVSAAAVSLDPTWQPLLLVSQDRYVPPSPVPRVL